MNTALWISFQIVWPLLLAGIIWVAARYSQLLAIKARNERMQGALLLVDIAAVTAMREVQQVFVDRLKATSGDGTLTPEQRTEAKAAAIASAKAQLGGRGLAELRHAFGFDAAEVEALLATRIEAAVQHGKALRRPSWDTGTAGDAVPFAA